MSNDLSVILSSVAAVQTGLDDDTMAVAGGSSGGANKRISIEGGVFRKIVGGKEVASIEDRHMNVIFVRMAHNASRTYYVQAYKKGVKTSPTCWSNDSKTPDPEVTHPQAATCNECPQAVKGSGQNGQGTACRLSWRTAVVLPNDPSGDVMQLVLPAASCFGKEDNGRWPFRPYIQMLANNNISASRLITKMQFDTKSSAPKLVFSPAAPIDPDQLENIKQQGKTAAAESAIKLTVYQTDEHGEDGVKQSVEDVSDEPVLRSTTSEVVNNATDVINKWSKKG